MATNYRLAFQNELQDLAKLVSDLQALELPTLTSEFPSNELDKHFDLVGELKSTVAALERRLNDLDSYGEPQPRKAPNVIDLVQVCKDVLGVKS
jgi:hypothetical protein